MESNPNDEAGCPNYVYPDWTTSKYVLPYAVGQTYTVNLSQCTISYHAEGQPDQFGIDFEMNIGTIITAARAGMVVHVEESGTDGNFPNNLVVVRHDDNTFAQYMHLTENGALVEVGDSVVQGTPIGKSGATGLAGYPHLHFIVTRDAWEYPYEGVPYNFKNTKPNPRSLITGTRYTANPY
jgi:murein DD-endopeptidase MepM/ murein hydrolase activator NlpD